MSSLNTDPTRASLLILRSGGASHLIKVPNHYQILLATARTRFPQLDSASVRLEVDFLGSGGVRVDASTWRDAIRLVQHNTGQPPVFLVKDKDSPVDQHLPPYSCTSDDGGETADLFSDDGKSPTKLTSRPPVSSAPRRRAHVVIVKTLTGKTFLITADSENTVSDVQAKIQDKEGIPPDQQRLIWAGRRLEEKKTLGEYGFDSVEEIHLVLRLRGDKPVIYLFPPVPVADVQVSLTIEPQWYFSSVYPLRDVFKDQKGSSTVIWDVEVKPDGQLVDLKHKTSHSYLFWEAEAIPSASSAAAATAAAATPPANGVRAFNPSNPTLSASNGVALPLEFLLPYLDKTLAALSLHTSARTDFITFWLPAFNRIASRGKQVGFRFLPQQDFDEAAKLKIEPRADVVTRVFLLFKGVGVDEAKGWKKPDEVDWVKEVGVEKEKVKDEGLFKVLEWGGMEVVG